MVVRAMMRWWDDVVFEKYPSWDECEQAGFFSGLILWLPRGRGRNVVKSDNVPLDQVAPTRARGWRWPR